ncbi:pyruvate, water dikinase regulatory protein [Jeotgalibacillus sp. R-1-5s-1]|uniref:pyruvate, water dikinase regulatory protein n=1 Tax=Jeotgalibacillus sp. R-1-5s-1 TaxID=2555897 RepID=UPI00106A28C8|nr:pyruvate, water dikinase regulatory protein [Jeotgalibacillus sp. R-1-5s-1]TFD92321.1 kinase/pyrophosphorylase [Jeotgalibacillus sp. R-1-5s-1]
MNEVHVYVVSDSVGETAELVAKACVSQFRQSRKSVSIKRFPYIEETVHVDEVISLAKDNHGIIVYTLVKPHIRDYIEEQVKVHNITAHDVVGPIISSLQEVCEESPINEPGMVHDLDEDYFKKIEAIEFAVKYDDGRDPRGILKADIVLVGVSRTSKTPLSQYLAHKRLKVANVPLVPEIDPPEELYKVNPKKCYGLKISPDKLNHIRKERLIALGLKDDATYAKMERIQEELDHFERVAGKIGCPVIDVTNKAVEETANVILNDMMS